MGAPPPDAGGAAIDPICRAHSLRVHALLLRATGRADDADDLAQELCPPPSRRTPPLREQPEAVGYLWKAASHAALSALRGDRRRRAREERAAGRDRPLRAANELDQDPAALVARRAEQEAVRAALRRLKPQEGALLLLRH